MENVSNQLNNAAVNSLALTADDLLFEELEERVAPAVIVPHPGSSSSSSCSSVQAF